jgi:hypothetical protein
VWQFRWSEKDLNCRRIYRKRVIGTFEQFTDEAAVRRATAGLLSEINLRVEEASGGHLPLWDEGHTGSMERNCLPNLRKLAEGSQIIPKRNRWVRDRMK